jgi:hypothetical protein
MPPRHGLTGSCHSDEGCKGIAVDNEVQGDSNAYRTDNEEVAVVIGNDEPAMAKSSKSVLQKLTAKNRLEESGGGADPDSGERATIALPVRTFRGWRA